MSTEPLYFVIPAYNEARSIHRVVTQARTCFPAASIVVVDDGSRDATAHEAASAGALVVRLPFNSGYGVALHTGLLKAFRDGAAIVVTQDADGQHDAAQAYKLIEPVERGEADIVLGSRYLPDSSSYKVPLLRLAGAKVFAWIVSRIIGIRITDPTSGFQCLSRAALSLYAGMKDFPEKTPDADLIVFAHRGGCRVLEAPVAMYEDESHDSMHGPIKSLFYVPKMLVSILGVLLMDRTKTVAGESA